MRAIEFGACVVDLCCVCMLKTLLDGVQRNTREGEADHPLRPRRGHLDRDVPARVVPHDRRTLNAECVEQAGCDLGPALDRVFPSRQPRQSPKPIVSMAIARRVRPAGAARRDTRPMSVASV